MVYKTLTLRKDLLALGRISIVGDSDVIRTAFCSPLNLEAAERTFSCDSRGYLSLIENVCVGYVLQPSRQ